MAHGLGSGGTARDEHFMRSAIALARQGWYSTRPNPRVGAVIVADDEIVGAGFHRVAGEGHAEIVALEAAGPRAAGATCYVTLEPCAHHGRTPPCTDALIAAGIERVVYAGTDPNPAVAGSGATALEAAGIAVTTGICEPAALALNRGFFSRMQRRRPRVVVKQATSLDGRIALASGESKWITGEQARDDVQRLRAQSGAIVTGIGTVLADDPRLTVRSSAFALPGPPLRVVVDSALRCPAGAALLAQPGRSLVCFTHAPEERVQRLRSASADLQPLPAGDGGVALDALLTLLADLEINDVLVEAGPALSGAFITAGLVDELVTYIAPRLLGDAARGSLSLAPAGLGDTPWLTITDIRHVGEDIRITATPRAA